MEIVDQQKKNIKNNFDFSRKEKALTRSTRIYIKLNGRDNTNQAKRFIFLVVPILATSKEILCFPRKGWMGST